MLQKNLIPNRFFATKGFGVDQYEFHAGAYHMALHDAGIDAYNIKTYSSTIPATAKLVSLDEVDLDPHGAELNCIMACAKGEFGQHISAGIIYAWMYEDEDMTRKHGGLVCEIQGHYSIETLEDRLYTVHTNLFEKTYKNEGLFMGEQIVITQGGDVPNDMRYGCAIVSLCFVDYLVENE